MIIAHEIDNREAVLPEKIATCMVAERQALRPFCSRVQIPSAFVPAMASTSPAAAPAGTDDEVRGWTSHVESDMDAWKAVTESEAETREKLAKKDLYAAASVVEEESACLHSGSSENENKHESIGLAKQKWR